MLDDTFRPRPAGGLAMLSYPYPPKELAGCREHVFQVHEPELVRVVDAQSGYLQRADCLVCGYTSPRMDATWWLPSPSRAELANAQALIEQRLEEEAQGADGPRLEAALAMLREP